MDKTMRTVGLFEAKQKLSELVERAGSGERIGITRRGRLTAVIVPAEEEVNLRQVFAQIGEIQTRARKPKRLPIKALIDEGRV
jgi:prevent-host-death family protein